MSGPPLFPLTPDETARLQRELVAACLELAQQERDESDRRKDAAARLAAARANVRKLLNALQPQPVSQVTEKEPQPG